MRMTWGKALLPWTKDPAAALEAALHLNHRFALDGCDPCSYGGVLWCVIQTVGLLRVFCRLRSPGGLARGAGQAACPGFS